MYVKNIIYINLYTFTLYIILCIYSIFIFLSRLKRFENEKYLETHLISYVTRHDKSKAIRNICQIMALLFIKKLSTKKVIKKYFLK